MKIAQTRVQQWYVYEMKVSGAHVTVIKQRGWCPLTTRQTWCLVPTIRRQVLFDKRGSNWTIKWNIKHPFETGAGQRLLSSSSRTWEDPFLLSVAHREEYVLSTIYFRFCQLKLNGSDFFDQVTIVFFFFFFASQLSFSSVQCSCLSPRLIMAPSVPTDESPFSSGDPCQSASYTKPSLALLLSLCAVNSD